MKKPLIFAILMTIVVCGCSTLSPSEDPVALRMQDLEARVIRIERVVENQSLIELSTEVDKLRAETQALRGELETLRYDSENSDSRQRELYVDVDRRLQTLESAPRAAFAPPQSGGFEPAAPSGAPAVAAAPRGTDQQNYQSAFDLIQARKYEEASRGFTAFLTNFPTSPLADNAQYWLAETFYVRAQYQTALAEFQRVLSNYPQSAKMPDAMLKVGYCQIELGDKAAGRATLQDVMRQFPDTTAARFASQRLDRLAQEGA